MVPPEQGREMRQEETPQTGWARPTLLALINRDRKEKPKTFEEWMSRVDRVLEQTQDLCSADLPDCPYRDWYDDDVSPSSAAKRAYRAGWE
jgi:hypothetical protein